MRVKTEETKLGSCCDPSVVQTRANEESLGRSCKFLMGDSRRSPGISDSPHNQSSRRGCLAAEGRRHKDKLYYQKTWKWKNRGQIPSRSHLFLFSLLGLLYLMVATVGVAGADEDWSAICPQRCKCIWTSGRKSVECREAGYTTIPPGLSDQIQALDLSDNPITDLPKHMFKNAGLLNLQRIYMKNCGIERVSPEAFQDLKILVDLNLSGNNITKINMETFSSNERLRELYLSGNPLSKLSGTEFPPLPYLKILDLRDCHLSELSSKSFHRLQNLEKLDLSGNRFQYLNENLLQPLGKLLSLSLRNNPWTCDCNLKSFRDWTISRKLQQSGTKCVEPPRMSGYEWGILLSADFACKPDIVTLKISGQARDALVYGDVGKDITLECLVKADPPPEVFWYRDSQAISNATTSVHGKTYLVHISGEKERWVNLTIIKSNPNDAGEYTCVGKNPGGGIERNLTLNFQDVPSGAGVGIGVGGGDGAFRDQSWLWILLGVIAVLLIITLALLLVCIYSRRRRVKTTRSQDLKGGQQQPLVERHGQDDTSPGDGVKSDGTTPLLTKGFPSGNSNLDPADASDYPDLLNLPHRPQESPAGSSSSTVPDSTRLIMPQQLNPAALYDPAGNSLTLSYRHPGILHHHGMGRPHSPYAGSVASFTSEPPQAIIPAGNRPGYVTLPRRPRVPSWSPATYSNYPSVSTPLSPPSPTGSSISGMGPFMGPKYDNLGPRTTADGSSKLSLNKIGLPGSEPSTPMNSATLPMPSGRRSAGLPYHSPAPHFNFAPIQEHDGPTTPTENNNHPYGLPLPDGEPPLSTLPRSWKPNESPQAENKTPIPSSVPGDRRSGLLTPSPSPMSPANTLSGKKVPPQPPPKPKKGNLGKDNSTETNSSAQSSSAPLPARDGDDGTEV